MEIIDTSKHDKGLNRIASDLAQAQQQQKQYKIQAFLSLGTAAILGTISAVSLSTNTVQPSDMMVAVEATAYFSLIAAAYNKFKEFDSGSKKRAIESIVDIFDHKDRNTIRHNAEQIIKKDEKENSLSAQVNKLRDKIFNTTENTITDKPSLK